MAKTSGQLERERRLKASEIEISDLSVCHFCKSTGLAEENYFCPNCGFPQRGTQMEMKKYLHNVKRKKQLLQDKKRAVKKARNILFILAGLNVFFGILLGAVIFSNVSILIGSLLSGGIYFALGLWTKKNPFAAILSGFFVYIVIIVINAIADPTTIFQGIFLKIIFISGFVYGYKGVKESEKIEKELQVIAEMKDLSESDAV